MMDSFIFTFHILLKDIDLIILLFQLRV